jgi:hypothetical protein
MVSSGGVVSISLSETYPAVLIKILGKTRSASDDEAGPTISFSSESNADCTESADVMSHS